MATPLGHVHFAGAVPASSTSRSLVSTGASAKHALIMSDFDGDLPSEAAISKTLRDIVIATHKSGKAEDLTLKRVRARAEQELGLDAGFFKQNSIWKQKSDTIVKDAVEKYCGDEAPPDPKPQTPVAKPKAKPKAQDKKVQGVKRKAAVPPKKPKKRRKTESEEESEEESEAELSNAESEPPKQSIRRGRQIVPEDSDEDNQETTKTSGKPRNFVVDEESDSEPSPRAKTQKRKHDVSESEMSELIEDSPAKKPKQKKTSSAKPKKEKAPTKPKATPAKSKGSDDPDEAEIKRLQGWLVKCGIRKIWSRDPALSKCNSAKEKIKVLRNLLKDAGMDGKYSNEKAAAIKEQREFAKDLAAIQEGELAWGNTGEVTSTGRPSRRAAAKPVPKQKVVLSDDSDEEMKSNEEPSADDGDDDAMEDVEESGEKDDDTGDDASDLD